MTPVICSPTAGTPASRSSCPSRSGAHAPRACAAAPRPARTGFVTATKGRKAFWAAACVVLNLGRSCLSCPFSTEQATPARSPLPARGAGRDPVSGNIGATRDRHRLGTASSVTHRLVQTPHGPRHPAPRLWPVVSCSPQRGVPAASEASAPSSNVKIEGATSENVKYNRKSIAPTR